VHLVARLVHGGFKLLDTQFVTEHLRQFGTIEVNRDEFQTLLEGALEIEADFGSLPAHTLPEEIVKLVSARA
jgi:leucyl/phenylalanyl-tRNA--protein transferase